MIFSFTYVIQEIFRTKNYPELRWNIYGFGVISRNLAVGACSTNARLGTIAAPYIVMLVRSATSSCRDHPFAIPCFLSHRLFIAWISIKKEKKRKKTSCSLVLLELRARKRGSVIYFNVTLNNPTSYLYPWKLKNNSSVLLTITLLMHTN